MPFLSLEFAALLAAAVLVFHALPLATRRHYLLVLSYAFYATWSPRYLVLLIGATTFTWLIGPRVIPADPAAEPGSRERRWLGASVVALLGLLFTFKYLPVIATSASPLALIATPIGVSYYTFRLTSYLIDVHWGKLPPERDFVTFALYVAFFPQILSGPIQRAGDFISQVEARRPVASARIVGGLRLILFGVFKKLIVANRLALLVNTVFDAPHRALGAAFLVATYAHTIQLYADFSGITDIAIGVGRLFGLESPPNFDNPFYSPNIQVFWQRWHMSLTSWVGDYLFTPLRMSLRNLGEAGLVLAILINMLAIGAWHGASWNYVVFGLVNGVYIAVSALTLKRRNKLFKGRPLLTKIRAVTAPLVTFHLFAFALVFFRAGSLGDALYIVRHLIPTPAPSWGLQGIGLHTFGIPGLVGVVVMETVHLTRSSGALRRALNWSPTWLRWSVYYAALGAILWFGQFGIQAFIYAAF